MKLRLKIPSLVSYLMFSFFLFSELSSQQISESVFSHPSMSLGITDIHETSNGGFLISGFGVSPGFDSTIALLIKTNDVFEIDWTKRYKTLTRDDLSVITSLADGNILVGGATRNTFSLIQGASVIKMDTEGNVIWNKIYADIGDYRIMEMFELADQTLMIFIRYGVTNQPTKILHTSATGEILTQQAYEFDNIGMFAENIARVSDNEFVLSGHVFNANNGNLDFFLAKLNTNSLLWYNRWNFGNTITSLGLAVEPNGNIIANGNVYQNDTGTLQKNWLARFDENGALNTAKKFDIDLENQFISDLEITADGNFICTGRSVSAETKALQFVTDNNFNVLNGKVHNEYEYQTYGGGSLISDGRYFFAGSFPDGLHILVTENNGSAPCSGSDVSFEVTDIFPTDSVTFPSLADLNVFTEELNLTVTDEIVNRTVLCEGSVGIETLENSENITVYPNPVLDQLIIEHDLSFHKISEHSFEISNSLGQILDIKTNVQRVSESKLVVNGLQALRSGIYFVRLNVNGEILLFKIVRE